MSPVPEPWQDAAALRADRLLAHAHLVLVDEDVEHAGVAEIEQRRQQRQARRPASRRAPRAPRAQSRGCVPPTQKPSALIFSWPPISCTTCDRSQHRPLRRSRPRCAGHLLAGVLPAQHEDRWPCSTGVTDERVFRLQVEDVELVDARRHEQDRPLVDLVGQRRVLDAAGTDRSRRRPLLRWSRRCLPTSKAHSSVCESWPCRCRSAACPARASGSRHWCRSPSSAPSDSARGSCSATRHRSTAARRSGSAPWSWRHPGRSWPGAAACAR